MLNKHFSKIMNDIVFFICLSKVKANIIFELSISPPPIARIKKKSVNRIPAPGSLKLAPEEQNRARGVIFLSNCSYNACNK